MELLGGLELCALDLRAICLRSFREALALAGVLALASVGCGLASAGALAGVGADAVALGLLGSEARCAYGTGKKEVAAAAARAEPETASIFMEFSSLG